MQIPVLIEPALNNGFRASGAIPFSFTVEGPTRAEVIQKLQQLIASRLKDGTELIQVDVVEEDNPGCGWPVCGIKTIHLWQSGKKSCARIDLKTMI